MAFHFFTGENSINNNQLPEMAYGVMSDIGGFERYNLENKFSVNSDSPAYAITKSLVIAVQDNNNVDVLNIALLPIDSSYTAGFPIKFFIYRGIKKSSLLENNGNIKTPDSTWSSSNILEIIKEIQDKINEDNETEEIAKSSSLGLDMTEDMPDDTFLESVFFDYTDEFQSLIVPRGCQIGEFIGGSTFAGVEVVLDKIGAETKIGILKSPNHLFEIPKINLTGLNEKQKLKVQFENRNNKGVILAYMDITAFYGACENQGYKVRGVSNNTSYLNNFYNKESVYIDIRDERGFSYNHLFKLGNTIEIGFYNTNNDIVYSTVNYYENWPILKLQNKTYNTSKRFFYIKLPIVIGRPESTYVLTSFTKKVSVGKSRRNIRYKLLNELDRQGNINLKESEPVRLKNWKNQNNILGANYFLLKLDKIEVWDQKQILSTIWNSFFSLDMNPLFGLGNIEEGEFRIKVYTSLNAPLVLNKTRVEVFYPIIGIAVDKSHVTFFSFYADSAHRMYRGSEFKQSSVIETGKFKYQFDVNDLEYQNNNQSIGFLYYMVNNHKTAGYNLQQFKFSDSENQIENGKYLAYQKSNSNNFSDHFFENFETITLTHDEFNHLKSLNENSISDQDFVGEHPFFVKSYNNDSNAYEKLNWLRTTLTLGVPKIEEGIETNNYVINFRDYPEAIQVDGEEIVLTSKL